MKRDTKIIVAASVVTGVSAVAAGIIGVSRTPEVSAEKAAIPIATAALLAMAVEGAMLLILFKVIK